MPEFTFTIRSVDDSTDTVENVSESFDNLGNNIVDELKKIREASEETGEAIRRSLRRATRQPRSLFGPVVSAASFAFRGVLGVFGAIGSALAALFRGAVSLVGGILNGLIGVARAVFSGVVAVVSGTVSTITSLFGSLVQKIASILSPLKAIIAGAIGTVTIKTLGDLAGQFQKVEATARALGREVGLSSQEVAAAIKRGSNEAITDLEALRLGSQSLAFGVARNAEDLERLAEASRRLGAIAGAGLANQAQAIERLNIAIARQTNLRLDDFTLVVNIERARAKFLETELNFSKVLTERERTLALLSAAERKLAEDLKLRADSSAEDAAAEREAADAILQSAIARRDFTGILGRQGVAAAVAAGEQEKLRKAIADLSEEQQKAAFRTAAFLEIDKALARFGEEAANNIKDRFGQITASIQNAVVDVAIILEPAFQAIADLAIPAVQRIRDTLNANAEAIQRFAVNAVNQIVRLGEAALDRIVELQPFVSSFIEDLRSIAVRVLESLPTFEQLKQVGTTVFRVLASEFVVFRDAVLGLFSGTDVDLSGSVVLAAAGNLIARLKLLFFDFSTGIGSGITEALLTAAREVQRVWLQVISTIAGNAGNLLEVFNVPGNISRLLNPRGVSIGPGGVTEGADRTSRAAQALFDIEIQANRQRSGGLLNVAEVMERLGAERTKALERVTFENARFAEVFAQASGEETALSEELLDQGRTLVQEALEAARERRRLRLEALENRRLLQQLSGLSDVRPGVTSDG